MFRNISGILTGQTWTIRGESPVVGSVDSPVLGKRLRGDSPEEDVQAKRQCYATPVMHTLLKPGMKRKADDTTSLSPSVTRPTARPKWALSTPRSPYITPSGRHYKKKAFQEHALQEQSVDVSRLPVWQLSPSATQQGGQVAMKNSTGSLRYKQQMSSSQRSKLHASSSSSRSRLSRLGEKRVRPSLLPETILFPEGVVYPEFQDPSSREKTKEEKVILIPRAPTEKEASEQGCHPTRAQQGGYQQEGIGKAIAEAVGAMKEHSRKDTKEVEQRQQSFQFSAPECRQDGGVFAFGSSVGAPSAVAASIAGATSTQQSSGSRRTFRARRRR